MPFQELLIFVLEYWLRWVRLLEFFLVLLRSRERGEREIGGGHDCRLCGWRVDKENKNATAYLTTSWILQPTKTAQLSSNILWWHMKESIRHRGREVGESDARRTRIWETAPPTFDWDCFYFTPCRDASLLLHATSLHLNPSHHAPQHRQSPPTRIDYPPSRSATRGHDPIDYHCFMVYL